MTSFGNHQTICILGGSSPFTAALVDAIADAPGETRKTLVLHGRDTTNLRRVQRYAEYRLGALGWKTTRHTDLNEALDRADLVLHQIRYGGLALRAEGERVCASLGVAADETLGPAALMTATQLIPALERVCNAIVKRCPAAHVLNLTNPLSAVTGAMQQLGVSKTVGLCELPRATQQTAARMVGLNSDEVIWSYQGLNHRGFIDTLRHGDRDLLAELPDRLGEKKVGGIGAAEIRKLGALPLKYFTLLGGKTESTYGRAEYLSELRKRISKELEQGNQCPASLYERDMSWYAQSVVPMINALSDDGSTEHIVNTVREDGLVVETAALVSREGIRPHFHQTQNHHVREWMDRFECHERCFAKAMWRAEPQSIEATVLSDPTIPSDKTSAVAASLISWLSARRKCRSAVSIGAKSGMSR